MNKNRLLSFIFSIGICLLSIFGFLIPREYNVVYADEVVSAPNNSFIGSNFDFSYRLSDDNNNIRTLSCSVDFLPNTVAVPKTIAKVNVLDVNLTSVTYEMMPFEIGQGYSYDASSIENGYIYVNDYYEWLYGYEGDVSSPSILGRIYCFVKMPVERPTDNTIIVHPSFNFDFTSIYKVSIGNNVQEDGLKSFTLSGKNVYYNYVCYTNSDDISVYICYPVLYDYTYWSSTNRLYSPRTYYLESVLTDSNSPAYQNGYQVGYDAGNYFGKEIGYNQGYDAGYNVGLVEANDYSFLSFFGAIFDAPINAFNNLFSFDILGVNIRSLILGLLTICIVILLVRFLVGGKG